MSERTVYHVVCRECRSESIVESRADAETLVEDHASTLDHRVEFAQVV